jgi:hypothetical protein
LLPCKNCICETCANQLTYTNVVSSNEIFQPTWKTNCLLCHEIHEKPENGFPVEESLLQIIKSKKECGKTLESLEQRQKMFEDRKKEAENLIRVNSEKMKSNFEKSIKTLMSRISSKKQALIEDVDNFEARNKERFEEMQNKLIQEPINDAEEFCRLKDANETPKRVVKHSICQCKELLGSLNLKKIDFDNFVENYLSTTFKEANIKFGESFIGNVEKIAIP